MLIYLRVINLIYKFYAIKKPFSLLLKQPNAFKNLINQLNQNQRDKILENFDEEDIKEGCISFLDDDTIDLHHHELTIYKKVNDAFCWMRVYHDYIELNDYEGNPFYHYLMRIHSDYIVIDEFDSLLPQKCCQMA